jgi:hypothetical protein
MREFEAMNLQERNPDTHKAHQRQVFWQITFPFVLAILLILALAGLAIASAFGGGEAVSLWADISLIWLIPPVLIVTLIFLLITAGLAYGVIRLIGVLPRYALKAQEFMRLLEANIRSMADKIAEPVIKVNGFWAGIRKLLGK